MAAFFKNNFHINFIVETVVESASVSHSNNINSLYAQHIKKCLRFYRVVMSQSALDEFLLLLGRVQDCSTVGTLPQRIIRNSHFEFRFSDRFAFRVVDHIFIFRPNRTFCEQKIRPIYERNFVNATDKSLVNFEIWFAFDEPTLKVVLSTRIIFTFKQSDLLFLYYIIALIYLLYILLQGLDTCILSFCWDRDYCFENYIAIAIASQQNERPNVIYIDIY